MPGLASLELVQERRVLWSPRGNEAPRCGVHGPKEDNEGHGVGVQSREGRPHAIRADTARPGVGEIRNPNRLDGESDWANLGQRVTGCGQTAKEDDRLADERDLE